MAGAGFGIIHIAKLAIGVGIFFLGLQLGMDVATKVMTMTPSTPAAS